MSHSYNWQKQPRALEEWAPILSTYFQQEDTV